MHEDGKDSRYDAGNPVPGVANEKHTEEIAYHGVVTEETAELAQKNAKLLITGNTAPRGGGIGTNGKVYIGEEDETMILQVQKEWVDVPDTVKIPDAVTAYLTIDGKVIKNDWVTLNKDNGWTESFSGLLLTDDINKYSVYEDPIEDFEPVITDIDRTGNTINITLENRYKTPDIPEKPIHDIHVEKIWDDGNRTGRPSAVKVYLVINGIRQNNQYIVLNGENNWKGVFEKWALYEDDGKTKINYTIEEEVPNGYMATTAKKEADDDLHFTITNKWTNTPTPVGPPGNPGGGGGRRNTPPRKTTPVGTPEIPEKPVIPDITVEKPPGVEEPPDTGDPAPPEEVITIDPPDTEDEPDDKPEGDKSNPKTGACFAEIYTFSVMLVLFLTGVLQLVRKFIWKKHI